MYKIQARNAALARVAGSRIRTLVYSALKPVLEELRNEIQALADLNEKADIAEEDLNAAIHHLIEAEEHAADAVREEARKEKAEAQA